MVPLLIGLLLALAPMAMASPPDPSWLGGLWDNADFDDVVLLVTGTAGVVEQDVVGPARTTVVVVSRVVPSAVAPLRISPFAAVPSRAPPASL